MNSADRKRLLAIALRRAKPGSGSAPTDAVREKPTPYGWSGQLPDLADIRHAIVGGLATALYMPERMTLDTDVLISGKDLLRAEELLGKAGYQRTGTLTIGGSSWRSGENRILDLIALDKPWVDKALASVVLDEAQRPFIGLPYLVLMKLESGRLQDLADIGRMLACAEAAQATATRALIAQYRPQDVEDLESIVHLGKLEHR